MGDSEIKNHIGYNKESGVFSWLIDAPGRRKTPGGKTCKGKYMSITINGKACYAHRLAWFLHYGEWPNGVIDHINGNGLDNRINNLRCVPQKVNARNNAVSKNNKSGYNGVCWLEKHKRWFAQIKVDGKTINLGLHAVIDDAVLARKQADKKYGFTTRR